MSTIRQRDVLLSLKPLIDNIGPYNEVLDEYDRLASYESLKNSRILIVGAGGLGCEILKNLALTGFKNIDIIDMDSIDLSNLNRQFLFRTSDIGKSKSEIATKFVKERIQDPSLNVTAHFSKIQDMPESFYKEFDIVICGLDSVEARRWINATIVSFVDDDLNHFIPIIDGGTEGFRGQSRVILPRITSCFECTLDMISPKVTYPICTIANTPRLPEHCIEWASVLQWNACNPGKKLDVDIPENLDWVYKAALLRAHQYGIEGVTKQLTLGVVKNIIPAIASTNAIIAASCCNEAFKFATGTNPILSNYMMYSGDDSIFTYTYPHMRKTNCPVCGTSAKLIEAESSWKLSEFIDRICNKQELSMKKPSLSTARAHLYLRSPLQLEQVTRPNLEKTLGSLISTGEEVLVTDPNLPIELRLIVKFVN